MKALMPFFLLLIISSCNKNNKSCEDLAADPSAASECSAPDIEALPTDPLEADDTGNEPTSPDVVEAPTDSQDTSGELPTEVPGDVSQDPETDDSQDTTSSSLPNEAFLFDATVKFTNFGVDDEDKVYKAIDIIKTVIRSEEFRDRVVNYTYQGKKQFVDNKGLSNEEIYQKLLDGKETLMPVVDHEMDLDLELYYSWRSTVGYTYPNTMRIWMNTKYFNYYTPSEVAGNIFHEWTHKLGFDHATYYSTSRDSSVPYAIGYLIEELGKKYE